MIPPEFVHLEALDMGPSWDRLGTRLGPSGLSVVRVTALDGADVDDAEEEEEKECLELVLRGHLGKSTVIARNPSCCWAHWSLTAVVAAVDEAAAAAAAAAASSCAFDGTLEPVGAS